MPVGHYDRTKIPRRGRPGYMLKRILEGDTGRDWMRLGACRRPDLPLDQRRAFSELFFPVVGRSHAAKRRYERQARAAKSICAQCPVRDDCLAHADRLGIDVGIWGGLTEEEREERTKQRRGGINA